MLRSIVSVVLGVILASIVMFVLETMGHLVYPPPADLDPHNAEAMKAYLMTAPLWVLLFVLLAWAAGAFVGGWLAAWIARRSPAVHALIVGGFLLLAGVSTMLMIPHPLWFWIAATVAILPMAYAGSRLPRRAAAVG